MLTTKEAAERLGVSVRRVNALIESGALAATRFGRAWMVEDRSVDERIDAKPTGGRPKMGERNPGNLVRYTLMNRNHPVLDFTYNRRTAEVGDLAPCEGIAYKPLGIGPWDREPNRYDLAEWIAARAVPRVRPRWGALLKLVRAATAADLMLESFGLNLSDQYWFRPEGSAVDWHAINYFENGYDPLGLIEELPRESGQVRSPDFSTSGMLQKFWMRRGGVDCLLKGGTGAENREPYNEVLATKLLDRLCGPGEFVRYELVEIQGRTFSSCPTMVSSQTELIAAYDVLVSFGVTEGRDRYRGYADACASLGVPDVGSLMSKMIVADHLMANFDRHTHNFGLIRNVETLDGYRVAPLFDNGCGFYSRATLPELTRGRYLWESHPFREYPSQQLALVEDMSWYDPECLRGFADDVAETLSGNPHLSDEFIEAVQRQTERQIDAVNDMAAERMGLFSGFGERA